MKEAQKKKGINQDVFDLYDDYVHDRIDRRKFLDKISAHAVGGVTVASLLSFIMPNYTENIQVLPDDPSLNTELIHYDSPNGGGSIKAQLSRPKEASGKLPGIVVVHENRGLNPHIAAFQHLSAHPECSGKVGVVGFCFGGWISNMMAVKVPDLSASVPFYGGQPSDEMVPKINAPLMLHYGELDTRVNEGWPAYEASLKKHNKEYQAFMYSNANHGFHNDTTPRYDEAAAKLAWQRTIDFFKEKLS